jgi:hypothetical protein
MKSAIARHSHRREALKIYVMFSFGGWKFIQSIPLDISTTAAMGVVYFIGSICPGLTMCGRFILHHRPGQTREHASL